MILRSYFEISLENQTALNSLQKRRFPTIKRAWKIQISRGQAHEPLSFLSPLVPSFSLAPNTTFVSTVLLCTMRHFATFYTISSCLTYVGENFLCRKILSFAPPPPKLCFHDATVQNQLYLDIVSVVSLSKYKMVKHLFHIITSLWFISRFLALRILDEKSTIFLAINAQYVPFLPYHDSS